jgi:hypothetical protein
MKIKRKTLKEESEFGKGLTYCLGLFLAHAERHRKEKGLIDGLKPSIWFNGSSDHLYDLVIPNNLPLNLQKRLADLKDKCIEWGHGFKIEATMDELNWSLEEAKELLRLIDEHHKIKTIEATWK